MPVHDPGDDDPIGPYNRLSHTQADTHRRCPRMWYNGYWLGLKGGQPPIFGMGHSVEGSLNRVMRDSPVLVPSNAHSEIFDSPVEPILLPGQSEAKERPSRQPDAHWPAPSLPTLPDSEWPKQREALRAWALARLDAHFPREWAHYRDEWENDPNKVGDWAAFEAAHMEDAKQWAANGIDFHLDEVEACLVAGGGPDLAEWRTDGNRPEWPSPDGFPYDHTDPHPSVQAGEVTWCEAWEIARPWFCDPDAETFSLTTTHPDGWLGGEYDLVYRWTGEARIFDVKASEGTSDFSFGYVDQMATYAYLWWVTHNRTEIPADLQIWYLGVPTKKRMQIPDEAALLRLEARMQTLHQQLRLAGPLEEADFPGTPTPVRSFGPGGQPLGEEPEGGMARCAYCEYAAVCSASPHQDKLATGGTFEHPMTRGASVECTQIGDIDPFITTRGRVRGLQLVKQWPTYEKEYWEFFLDFEPGDWVAVVVKVENPELPTGLAEGDVVRIRNGIIFSGWKKAHGYHLRLDVGGRGTIEMATDPEADDLPYSGLLPLSYNIRAKLFNFEHKENDDYSKWGARLVDDTGVIGFQIWDIQKAREVLLAYHPERGSEVLVVGATPKDQHGKLLIEGKITKNLTTKFAPAPGEQYTE